MSKHPYLAGSGPRFLAHRGLVDSDGATAGIAENSFAAVAAAHAAGASYVESDCHLTSDGVVVLFHDSTLERVTGDPRELAQVTSAELSTLMETRGGLITLKMALESFPKTRFNIDIKADGTAIAAAEIIAPFAERVLVTSFSDKRRRQAAARFAELNVRPAYAPGKSTMIRLLVAVALGVRPWQRRLLRDIDALQVPERFGVVPVLSKRLIAVAHRNEVEVHVWTINRAEDMRRLLACGVDAIVTDRVDLALSLRATG